MARQSRAIFGFLLFSFLFGHSVMDPCTIRGQNAQNFMQDQMSIHALIHISKYKHPYLGIMATKST